MCQGSDCFYVSQSRNHKAVPAFPRCLVSLHFSRQLYRPTYRTFICKAHSFKSKNKPTNKQKTKLWNLDHSHLFSSSNFLHFKCIVSVLGTHCFSLICHLPWILLAYFHKQHQEKKEKENEKEKEKEKEEEKGKLYLMLGQ